MPSISARLFRFGMRRLMKPTRVDEGFVDRTRRRVSGRMAITLLPRRVRRRAIEPGEFGRCRGEWLGVPGARRHVLYLHGGYYVAGRTKPHRNLGGRLADGLGANVVLLDYSLAPEHPYPAAVDDGMSAYRALLADGVDPATVAIAGDSAGGGLTLALLLRAKADPVPLPAAAVLFSPWTDLSCSNPSVDRNDSADDVVSAAALRWASACYAGAHDRCAPELSPIYGSLAGLPPLFVAVDSSETLLDDSLQLVERVRQAGGVVRLQQTAGLVHAWPTLVPYLPEARATVADVVAFLDAVLA